MIQGPLTRIVFFVAFLIFVLSHCSSNPLGSVVSPPGNAEGGTDSSSNDSNSTHSDDGGATAPGSEDAFNSAGVPVDIPVTVAKVIRPVNPRTVNAITAGSEVVFTAQADPNVSVKLYDGSSNAINEVVTDAEGNFSVSVPVAQVPLESPVSFVVTDGDSASAPVTVMTYSDNSFTVAVTGGSVRTIGDHTFEIANLSDYQIPDKNLAYSPRCEGVAYNANHLAGQYPSILCVNTVDASTLILLNRISAPLDQMQFSSDGKFVVGLNHLNQIVHIDLDTGTETVISDSPVAGERPTIRLSMDDAYVLTTAAGTNTHNLAALEPTRFSAASQNADRILISQQTAVQTITECDWFNTEEIQCIFKDDASSNYTMLRYDLSEALASNNLTPEITPIPQPFILWQSVMRNVRIRPEDNDPLLSYETENSLRMSNYAGDFLVASNQLLASLLTVVNSNWSLDGQYLYLNATFSVGVHPGKLKVMLYTPPSRPESIYGSFYLAGYGGRPTAADPGNSNILAYLCDDQAGKKQVCVLNKDTLNSN